MERFIRSGDARIWTEATGEPLRGHILMASGGPGCCDYLGPVADMLADKYRVIRFEQRGCGRSTADENYGIMTAVSDLEAIRQAYGLESWIVAGHSWGAALALVYALTHPQRAQAVLYMAGCGFQSNRVWLATFKANREAVGEQLPEMAYPYNPQVNEMGNASFREYIQRPTLWAELAKLEVPALFLNGERDIRPSWPVEQIAALMPNARLQVIRDAAHYLWLTHPDQTRATLRAYLGF